MPFRPGSTAVARFADILPGIKPDKEKNRAMAACRGSQLFHPRHGAKRSDEGAAWLFCSNSVGNTASSHNGSKGVSPRGTFIGPKVFCLKFFIFDFPEG